MECQINGLGFCIGCPEKFYYGENCKYNRKCKYVHTTPQKGWAPTHDNCRFQEQNKNNVEQTDFDKVLTDKLTICTLNIKKDSDRDFVRDFDKLKEFFQKMSYEDSIVCLQEFRNDQDLMKLLEHLKETKSKFAYCARSSHGHCAVLSTLPLQEVENRVKCNYECIILRCSGTTRCSRISTGIHEKSGGYWGYIPANFFGFSAKF